MSHASVNLADKLATFEDHFSPRTVATCNGHDVMVVKLLGEFHWHDHGDTDDFFLVLSGRLRIDLRDGHVELGPGELLIVPVGVEHRPVALEETHLLLIEPTGTSQHRQGRHCSTPHYRLTNTTTTTTEHQGTRSLRPSASQHFKPYELVIVGEVSIVFPTFSGRRPVAPVLSSLLKRSPSSTISPTTSRVPASPDCEACCSIRPMWPARSNAFGPQ